MSPQPVVIYGVRCTLQETGGDRLTRYAVTSPAGAVLAQHASRFMVIAQAAQVLRNSRSIPCH